MCVAGFAAFAQPQEPVTTRLVDRSTPEAAVGLLLENADVIVANFETLEARRARGGGLSYPQPTDAERARVERALRILLQGLDLSAAPEWSRETVGVESALMLRELLRRAAAAGPLEFIPVGASGWMVKSAYIHLVKLGSGPRFGEVVFSSETLSTIGALYAESIAETPIAGFDAYRYFTETPGGVFPPPWAGYVLNLPDALRAPIGSNTIWQWAMFAIALCVLATAPASAFLLPLSTELRALVAATLGLLLSWYGQDLAIKEASFTGAPGLVGSAIMSGAFYLSLAVMAFIVIEALSARLVGLLVGETDGPASGLSRLLFRILGVAASLAVALYGLSSMGIPVVGIVAGLGVGGLAVALAAKTTLENLLACFVLHLDKSVRVGDVIVTKELSGVVEHIGMRSIRVRADNGDITTITNSKFADLTITKKTTSADAVT